MHFHVGGIPVDCMIISLEDFTQEYPENEFMLVHLNCKILFDRDGSVKKTLERIKRDWSFPENISKVQVSLYRFIFKHILDKLEYRLHDNKLFSNYFIYASFDFYLDCYSRIMKLEVGKPKVHFEYIKNNNEELFEVINKMYETQDLDTRFEMLKRCARIMIEPIGGLWKDEEVIFHMISEDENLDSEQEQALDLLLK